MLLLSSTDARISIHIINISLLANKDGPQLHQFKQSEMISVDFMEHETHKSV